MTITGSAGDDGGAALAGEAAHWFARMRGPDAQDDRAAFETWLARSPAHLAAYNRAAEIFALGKLLAEPDDALPPPPHMPAPARRRAASMAFATLAACALGIGGWAALERTGPSASRQVASDAIEQRRIATRSGETRTVRLADGSSVRLREATILDVDFDSAQRRLTLLRGAARFEVAHAQRPFIVLAGGGSVTARGTVFDVALTRAGKVDVQLRQGAVDVTLPRTHGSASPAIQKLRPGQGVSFAAQRDASSASTARADLSPKPIGATREFEATRLDTLIAIANQGAARPIRLADAALGERRVSGRFRVDDTELLARRLGALFDAQVDLRKPGEIILSVAEPREDAVTRDGRPPDPHAPR